MMRLKSWGKWWEDSSDEEAQVDLVVKQSREDGNHIVQKLIKAQELERISISKRFYAKKADIVSLYNAAQNRILEAKKVLIKSTTATFESR